MPKRQTQKVVLLGDSGVGKTALVRRYIRGEFSGRESQTRPVPLTSGKLSYDKSVHVGEAKVDLNIWDTPGEEMYHTLQPMYYNNTNAALLVYDVTDSASFDRVKKWIKELKSLDHHVVIVVAGNKCDLLSDSRRKPAVSQQQVENEIDPSIPHVLTSAKTDAGVQNTFVKIARGLISNSNKKSPQGSYNSLSHSGDRPFRNSNYRTVAIVDEETTPFANPPNSRPSSGCCCVVS
eukprot:TRINITY_DN1939_c1_g1_i1.p1 TRINITY_DN1939_c1_g1~~TRINITY_DN1939_c1_g1_i1.p1  ORF type:complete len:249 (+),score=35.49 TRINITY_DN1939_c1_g1_i1:45-749(+)